MLSGKEGANRSTTSLTAIFITRSIPHVLFRESDGFLLSLFPFSRNGNAKYLASGRFGE